MGSAEAYCLAQELQKSVPAFVPVGVSDPRIRPWTRTKTKNSLLRANHLDTEYLLLEKHEDTESNPGET